MNDQPTSIEPIVEPGPEPQAPASIEFEWAASEYVLHHKTISWYLGVIAVVILLSVGAFFLHAWLSIVLFIVMGVTVIVFAQRPPRTLTYRLSAAGLMIDEKLYEYHLFRSFSVLRDVAWHSIDLEPTQRFMPRMSVLFNDADFDPIVSHLTEHLPRIEREPDLIERATRYLRF